MIVDEADKDIAMAKDPFLEAGIDIPEELPYQPTPVIKRKMSIESISGIPMRLNSIKKKFGVNKSMSTRPSERVRTRFNRFSFSGKPSTSNLENDKSVVPSTAPINASPEIGEFCFPAPSNESSSVHSIQKSEEKDHQGTDCERNVHVNRAFNPSF